MNFSRHPFSYVTAVFIAGVIAAKFSPIPNHVLLVSLILSTTFLLVLGRKFDLKSIYSAILLNAFFFVGAFSLNNKNPELFLIPSEKVGLIMNVDEIEGRGEFWRKSICSVVGVVDSVELTMYNERILMNVLDPTIEVGDQLYVKTELINIENKNNPGEFNVESFWKNKGIYRSCFAFENQIRKLGEIEIPWYKRVPSKLRNYFGGILENHLQGDALALAKALVLGDKELLSADVKASFSNAGAMHVLAVSGLHVGILLMIIQFVLKRFKWFVSNRWVIYLSLITIWMYAGITNFSPSVVRASFMFSLLSLGRLYSKQYSSINILFFTAFILLLFEPNFLFDIGFQLSYLAMIGIFMFYDSILKLIYVKNKFLLKIWQGTVVGISAQLLTLPLTLFFFHQFPNYFAFTNIGIMALAGIVLSGSMLLFVVRWVPYLSSVIGISLGFCFMLLLSFVQFVEGMPGAVASGFSLSVVVVIILYLLILLYFLFGKNQQVVLTIGLVVFLVFGYIQFNRYQNLTKNELVIFNSNQFTSIIKVGNQAVCLYYSHKLRPKHLRYIVGGYSKVRPALVSYQKLERGMTTVSVGGKVIKIEKHKYGVFFYFKGKTILVRFRGMLNPRDEWTIVDMPNLSIEGDMMLSDGAVAFEI
ncbi:MAG: ComEC family competence protein [Crocinitomicaceae bacterium]|nr:ComEC family competence protein [Crocinitomicaceae bacterium]